VRPAQRSTNFRQVAPLRRDLLARDAEPPRKLVIPLARMAPKLLVRKEHAARVQLCVAARKRPGHGSLVDIAAVKAHDGHEAHLRVARAKRVDPRRQIHPASSRDGDELASIRNRSHAR
jgi:hypothetical protein